MSHLSSPQGQAHTGAEEQGREEQRATRGEGVRAGLEEAKCTAKSPGVGVLEKRVLSGRQPQFTSDKPVPRASDARQNVLWDLCCHKLFGSPHISTCLADHPYLVAQKEDYTSQQELSAPRPSSWNPRPATGTSDNH